MAPLAHASLLAWYAANQRALPWRSDPAPYHVLLSELMAQQTRIETMLPYYARFKTHWPTLADLAAATEAEVVTAWAGLGYYSRARSLHKCAVTATELGGLPSDAAALRKLPGIGPYTAGAIASVAFGQPAAVVDGNVERVLCRVLAIEGDPRATPQKKRLWQAAQTLVDTLPDGAHPGDWNQALMELGATLCKPQNPACDACPLADCCTARATDRVQVLPTPRVRKKPKRVDAVAAVVRVDGQLLLGLRAEGLLAGLWGPPVVEGRTPEDVREALATWGLAAQQIVSLGRVRHVFTHRDLRAAVFGVRAQGTPVAAGAWSKIQLVDGVEGLGLSRLAEKILALEASPGLPLPR